MFHLVCSAFVLFLFCSHGKRFFAEIWNIEKRALVLYEAAALNAEHAVHLPG